MVQLESGEGMFIPYSEDSVKELSKKTVHTILVENDVPITIDKVYPELIFPSSIISLNSIIISDEDFMRLQKPYAGSPEVEPGYHLFTFDIPQWLETEEIGLSILHLVSNEKMVREYNFPFYFENAWINLSYVFST